MPSSGAFQCLTVIDLNNGLWKRIVWHNWFLVWTHKSQTCRSMWIEIESRVLECGQCWAWSEHQVMLWRIELTFAFNSDWTQLVFIASRERDRDFRQRAWYCTTLANPFIGHNHYDIRTICHHIKMDDHLHSYTHKHQMPEGQFVLFCPKAGFISWNT